MIWGCWIRQGWHNQWQQNQCICISRCRRHFIHHKWMLLKGVRQVLDLLHVIPILILFQVSFCDVWLVVLNAEAVKEVYDKMLESVNVKRSMPPNAWLWSMIEKCANHDDIKLLFDILQNMRRFVRFYFIFFVISFVCYEFDCLFLLFVIVIIVNLFGSRGCQIFAFMQILMTICVEKLLKLVLESEPLTLVGILYIFFLFNWLIAWALLNSVDRVLSPTLLN